MHHVEAVEQVLPEPPLKDLLLQIPVGGSNDPHVHLQGLLSTDPLKALVLQHPQNLYLHVLVDLPNLVQKDCPPICQLEAPPLSCGRPGEGSLLVAEQLTFQQALGQGGTVHLNEGLVLSGGKVVEGVGNQLLSRAALAGNQHRCLGIGSLPHHLEDPLHLGALADDGLKGGLGIQLLLQGGVADFQLPPCQRPLHNQGEAVKAQGLGEKVVGSVPHGVHRCVDAAVAGQHNDRNAGTLPPHSCQHLLTGNPRHTQIRNHQVNVTLLNLSQALTAIGCQTNGISLQLQGGGQTFPNIFLVVNNQDSKIHDVYSKSLRSSWGMGSEMVKTVPSPSRDFTCMSPENSLTIL